MASAQWPNGKQPTDEEWAGRTITQQATAADLDPAPLVGQLEYQIDVKTLWIVESIGPTVRRAISVGAPVWTAVAFAANWTFWAAGEEVEYTKIDGWVFIRGLVKNTAVVAAPGSTIFTLPVGFRPQKLTRLVGLIQAVTPTTVDIDVLGVCTSNGTAPINQFWYGFVCSFYAG